MRRVAALASAALLAAVTLVPLAGFAPAGAASAAVSSSTPLTVSLVQMAPWTPSPSKTRQPFSVTVELHNTTGSDVDGVRLSVGRGNPVSTQAELDASLSDPSLPADLISIPARPAPRSGIDVPAYGSTQATFRTTSTTTTPCRLCLYANAVYPIFVSAVDAHSGAVQGYTRTFVASTDGADDKGEPLHKVDVAWVWPLIDKPHRLAGGRIFTDRSLPRELAPTGRLSRALQVVEDVGTDHPMTLVLDPELIDEVAILAGGDYTYQVGSQKAVTGHKVADAGSWLTRLRTLLADDGQEIDVEFTPYADPDVQGLTAHGLTWQSRMPLPMLEHVRRALGLTTIPRTLSWPPGDAASSATLARIAANGATDVLLDDSSVRPTNLGGLPTSTATMRTPQGKLSAALTSPAMQHDVAASISYGGAADLSHLPALLAEIAIRADTGPYESRTAFLAAPRYVNPDVAAAERVIRETTTSTVSTAMSLQAALTAGESTGARSARARHLSASTPVLSAGILSSADQLTRSLPALHDLLSGPGHSPGIATLLADLGRGRQRVESAAYLSTSSVSSPAAGRRVAARLRRQVARLLRGVYIVPESGHRAYTYTLASTNSPLPITVDNTLPYRVFVHIEVATAGGLPGLTTRALDKPVAAGSKQTFRVPAHVQRSGRIALTATLTTPGGAYVLGSPVRLTVHSTAVGTIGIVITVVAAVVLFLALVVRYIRRLQRLRRTRRASSGDPRVPARIGS